MAKELKNEEVMEIEEVTENYEDEVTVEETGERKKMFKKVLKIGISVASVFGIGYLFGKKSGAAVTEVVDVVEDVIDAAN